MVLLHAKHKETVATTYMRDDIKDVIYDICESMHYALFNKFILVYQSSYRARGGKYYMCFTSTEGYYDEYVIASEKFIPLKEIDLAMKETAKIFHSEGGAITKYV